MSSSGERESSRGDELEVVGLLDEADGDGAQLSGRSGDGHANSHPSNLPGAHRADLRRPTVGTTLGGWCLSPMSPSPTRPPTGCSSDYFAERAASFPAAQGAYRTTFPDPAQFVAAGGRLPARLRRDDVEAGCGGVRELRRAAGGHRTGRARSCATRSSTSGSRRRTAGGGLGRAILAELEHRARGFGATEVVLDTNASLEAAGGLYRSHGYENIQPYNDNPNATDWFRKPLS